MIAATIESHSKPRRHWLLAIAVVMAGQIGLIFWLSRHGTVATQTVNKAPAVYRAMNAGINRLDVSDPALFVLPNPRGFSGNAWMKTAPLEYKPLEWTEPPRPLALSTEKLGSALAEFARTNLAGSFELASKPEPLLALASPPPDLGAAQSILTVEGDLARRPLLSKFKLDSWPASDILNDSVVQVGVDAEGTVFSAVLLNEPRDLKEAKVADTAALNLARSAQFQPLAGNNPAAAPTALEWGRLVFHWHVIQPPVTNSTVANP